MATLPLDKLETNVENLYEACLIIAKRARQINTEQNSHLKIQLGDFDTDDELEEASPDRESVVVEYDKLPKPTMKAIEEMIDGKIEYEYKETEEEQ
jgi:DNA-directed RNA polymerase omega subunit